VRPGKAACLAVVSATVLYVQGASSLYHPQRFVTSTQNSIADMIAGPQFSDAAFSFARYHDLAGTYVDAGVEGRRISVLWATDRAYCVEGVSQSGLVEYLLGPHGHVMPGHCPYNAF
jgi:hypothetical protein